MPTNQIGRPTPPHACITPTYAGTWSTPRILFCRMEGPCTRICRRNPILSTEMLMVQCTVPMPTCSIFLSVLCLVFCYKTVWLYGRNCVVCAVIRIGELKLSRDILSWYHKRRETHKIPNIDPNQSRLIFRSSSNASQCRAEMRSHISVSIKMITFIKWATINILLRANYSPMWSSHRSVQQWNPSFVTGRKTF